MPLVRPEDLMSNRTAALRGAIAGMGWATAWTVAVTLAVAVAGGPRRELPLPLSASAGLFAPSASEVGGWAATIPPAAAMAGALIGLLSRRIRVRPWARAVWLWLAFFPAVGVSVGLTLWAVASVMAIGGGPSAPFESPLPAIGLGLFGTVIFSPALAIPLLLASVTIERWTRPVAFILLPPRR